ncbi:hypothetical protein [Donghicola eburneus]|uniref:Putative membrane protein n=1 Tax=Donghicola eburneus TaxID=393278 RepID=A0A1M4MYL5_9RHOB|nr:hypothetical protein [Donghicola eburneus]SCM67673.1 putative membrane protein [Donghicola eburneus]SFQ10033.1 hypothetical protein SAMN05421764_101420 [Donghicola eburneus]
MRSSDRPFAALAAAVCGLTYLVGLLMYATIFAGADLDAAGVPSIRTIAFIVTHSGALRLWYFSIYVVNGLALLMLVLALSERNAPLWRRWITGVGFVWSALVIAAGLVAVVALASLPEIYRSAPSDAARHWHIATSLIEGIGGGTELLGALWVLGIATGSALVPAQKGLAVVVGTAGVLTLHPALAEAGGAVFGIGFMGLFFWIAVTLWPRCNWQSIKA